MILPQHGSRLTVRCTTLSLLPAGRLASHSSSIDNLPEAPKCGFPGPTDMKNNVRLHSSNKRVIAAMLMFFVLGLVFVNARSTSHGQFAHHHVGGGHHISEDGKQYGDAAITASSRTDTDHSDQHDPGDHTHDVPLRFILAVGALTVMQAWQPDRPIPIRNCLFFLLERPPKR